MGGYNYEGAWVKHSTSTLCGVPSSTALYSILFFALLGTQGITRCVKCLRINHAEMKHALLPPPWVIPAGASTWYSLKIDEVNTRKHTAVAENFEVHDNTLLLCSAAWLKGFVYGCCTAVLLYGRHGAPM